MNSFTIDGVDDNRIDLTGHTQYVIPEAVSDFNLITNQFAAEYGHSAGGQFNTITKSGTNDWHGGAWEFNNNRDYNAYDNLEKENVDASGRILPKPRYDFNRAGGEVGGPIIHDKLFIYGAFARIIQGLSPQAVAPAYSDRCWSHDARICFGPGGARHLEAVSDRGSQRWYRASDGTWHFVRSGMRYPDRPYHSAGTEFLESVGFHDQCRCNAGQAFALLSRPL